MSGFKSLVTVEYPATNGYSYQEFTINMNGSITEANINLMKMLVANRFKDDFPGKAIKSITVHYTVDNKDLAGYS